jgi:hypothetical protein
MQRSIFEPSDLMTLEAPDPITHALFESPTIPGIGAAVLGVVLLLALRSRGKARHGFVAFLGGLLVGGSLFVSASLVTTQRERLVESTSALVVAAAQGDGPDLESLLHPDVRVRARFASPSGRDEIIALCQTRAARLIEDIVVRETQAQVMGERTGRSLVKVRVHTGTGQNISWWMIDWERPAPESDQWRATRIEPLWIQGYDNPAG